MACHAFEGNKNACDGAQSGKDQIHPEGNPVHDGLTIFLVYAYLGSPPTSHDFPSGMTFEQQPDEYGAYR